MFQILPIDELARTGDRRLFEGCDYFCSPPRASPALSRIFHLEQCGAHCTLRGVPVHRPDRAASVADDRGTDAATSWMATNAFANAQEPKELFGVDDATHVVLYDKVP